MNILVTGGTVFASRCTAEFFAAKGHKVYVLNRGTRPQSEGVELICTDRHCLGDKLKGYHFDAVIDVTSYNGNDVSLLLDALEDFGEYIMISSSAVYPETLPQPFSESQKTGANSIWGAYGTNKIEAERVLTERVPNAYILRPPYLYGRMNNLYREAFVFECAEKKRPFYIPEKELSLQFFDIEDMCSFMELLLEIKPSQRIFNVGNPESLTVSDWVRLCYKVVGTEPEFIQVPADIPQRSYFPFYAYQYTLDVTEMLKIMDQLTPPEKVLSNSYTWFADHRDIIVRKPLIDFIDSELRGAL